MLPNICSRYERMRCSRIKKHNCRSVIDEKHTNDNMMSFLRFFHDHVIDSPTGLVLLGSSRIRVGYTGRGRCSYSGLISMSVWIGASVDVMSLFTIVVAPTISLQWVLGSLGPLNTLIPSSRSLEIVGAHNHLMLQGGKSLSSCLWLQLRLRLNRTEHRSS
jgi:hypothetical protein